MRFRGADRWFLAPLDRARLVSKSVKLNWLVAGGSFILLYRVVLIFLSDSCQENE